MNTLFDKGKKPGKDDVKLIPDGNEPTQTWQVHLMKPGVFKLKPGMNSVFGDANVYAKESIRPDIPTSIRTHFENQTIPSNAVAHPKGKSHPPGAYVWERDGYLAYVITDGKGKNGYYNPQVLKLNSDKNSIFNKDMRYYMMENGMPPDMAVAAHTKQWDELYRMILTGFALSLATAGPVPRDGGTALELYSKNLMFHGVEKLKEAGEEAVSHAK